mmetsp:Transcript_13874/g.43186  ORF Transcript_13874/g.43186 Transcript_13874/m.43186 type:complete len:225 (+) Transcript_13874:1176-1850(+)
MPFSASGDLNASRFSGLPVRDCRLPIPPSPYVTMRNAASAYAATTEHMESNTARSSSGAVSVRSTNGASSRMRSQSRLGVRARPSWRPYAAPTPAQSLMMYAGVLGPPGSPSGQRLRKISFARRRFSAIALSFSCVPPAAATSRFVSFSSGSESESTSAAWKRGYRNAASVATIGTADDSGAHARRRTLRASMMSRRLAREGSQWHRDTNEHSDRALVRTHNGG